MMSGRAQALAIVTGSLVLVLTTYLILTGATPVAPTYGVRTALMIANLFALVGIASVALSWSVGVIRRLLARR